MAYYMAQTKETEQGWEAICEVHGSIAIFEDQDDAIDGASGHDSDIHDYDCEDGFDEDE